MDVQKFFEAIAAIISAREGVIITVKSIEKAAGTEQEPAAMKKII